MAVKSKKPVTKNGQVVSMRIENWDDKGKTLLEPGTHRSVGNDESAAPVSKQHFLEMLNANMMHRHKVQQEQKKPPTKSRRDMLDELFG